MSVRILNAEPENYCDEARAILEGLGELVERPVAQARLAGAAGEFDVLIVRLGLRVTRDVLEADRLRTVVTATTGLDHVDLQAAEECSVTVLSLKGEQAFLRTIPATAEHTWALLLALVRQIPWAFGNVLDGGWDRDRFKGRDLFGKRLGILGLGRLGEKVAGYGLAFGMRVAAYDPYRAGWVDRVDRAKTIEALLDRTDFLCIHLPLNEETEGMLTGRLLGLLPAGARVVNTSRGAILDEAALAKLLGQGHIAGAAVDVLADEQPDNLRQRSPLLQYAGGHDNLLITPHIGGATFDSMRMTEVFMAEKLRGHLLAGR